MLVGRPVKIRLKEDENKGEVGFYNVPRYNDKTSSNGEFKIVMRDA